MKIQLNAEIDTDSDEDCALVENLIDLFRDIQDTLSHRGKR